MTYEHWRERLGEANDPELYPLAWQDHLVATGAGLFICTDDFAMVLETEVFPSGIKACKIYAATGNMASMIERAPQIEAWAKSSGCSRFLIEGRDGWRRALPDYRHHKTILIKEL